MNSFVYIALFAALAFASAEEVLLPTAKVLQGPSSRATILGPDGSSIVSETPGGSVVTEEGAAVVARTIPAVAVAEPAPVAKYVQYPAPLSYSLPLPIARYAAPAAYTASPYLAPYNALSYAALPYSAYSLGYPSAYAWDSFLSGPAGLVATTKTLPAATYVAAV